jgi:regulator of replication initiation timing
MDLELKRQIDITLELQLENERLRKELSELQTTNDSREYESPGQVRLFSD